MVKDFSKRQNSIPPAIVYLPVEINKICSQILGLHRVIDWHTHVKRLLSRVDYSITKMAKAHHTVLIKVLWHTEKLTLIFFICTTFWTFNIARSVKAKAGKLKVTVSNLPPFSLINLWNFTDYVCNQSNTLLKEKIKIKIYIMFKYTGFNKSNFKDFFQNVIKDSVLH